ncbi:MAG: ATP-binding protein [Treponema sp.]|nr:ATP-binding protein [Treponema sp.]
MENWFSVESALYRSQNASETNNSADDKMVMMEELLSALEQFRLSLNDFTGSLLFTEYNRTGLIPKESGIIVSRLTDSMLNSVKAGENRYDFPETAESADALMQAEAIRKELNSWFLMDSRLSSQVFERSIWIMGVFLFCIIILAIAICFLYRALRRSEIMEQESVDFSRISMLAQEKERALISVELHDTVLQDLGRLLQMTKEGPSWGNPFSELAREIMTKTRELCRELMLPDFSRLALSDCLVQLCADFEKRTSVECRAIIAPDFSAYRLSPEMQLQVYRIIQEALINIEKHAGAGEVTLTARNKDGKALLICITDDGIGMSDEIANLRSKSPISGLGIRGMYQRASILGASLSFISGAGSGLTVRLELPFGPNGSSN